METKKQHNKAFWDEVLPKYIRKYRYSRRNLADLADEFVAEHPEFHVDTFKYQMRKCAEITQRERRTIRNKPYAMNVRIDQELEDELNKYTESGQISRAEIGETGARLVMGLPVTDVVILYFERSPVIFKYVKGKVRALITSDFTNDEIRLVQGLSNAAAEHGIEWLIDYANKLAIPVYPPYKQEQ